MLFKGICPQQEVARAWFHQPPQEHKELPKP